MHFAKPPRQNAGFAVRRVNEALHYSSDDKTSRLTSSSKVSIKYHSEAREEFFANAEYYEEQVVGLGDKFIYEVEKVLDVISQYPSSGTLITPNERRFLVSRFPYDVIYAVEDVPVECYEAAPNFRDFIATRMALQRLLNFLSVH